MTENTVKFHLKNIFVKLGVDKRSHAISVARRLNLLP
jgi:LuxR family maltose regulon positive regulatory protein